LTVEKIAPYYKAVAGALIAFLSALISGLVDGSLSWVEILTALIALIVGGGAVFRIPNIPSAAQVEAATQEMEASKPPDPPARPINPATKL
jgi:hypothetical protein